MQFTVNPQFGLVELTLDGPKLFELQLIPPADDNPARDTWTPGHPDTRTPGRTPGHPDTWTPGHLDTCIVNLVINFIQ